MPDIVEIMKERGRQIRLKGTVLLEKNVCGFIYRIYRNGDMTRTNLNGSEGFVSRSEAEDTFNGYEIALARQAIRHSFAVA